MDQRIALHPFVRRVPANDAELRQCSCEWRAVKMRELHTGFLSHGGLVLSSSQVPTMEEAHHKELAGLIQAIMAARTTLPDRNLEAREQVDRDCLGCGILSQQKKLYMVLDIGLRHEVAAVFSTIESGWFISLIGCIPSNTIKAKYTLVKRMCTSIHDVTAARSVIESSLHSFLSLILDLCF